MKSSLKFYIIICVFVYPFLKPQLFYSELLISCTLCWILDPLILFNACIVHYYVMYLNLYNHACIYGYLGCFQLSSFVSVKLFSFPGYACMCIFIYFCKYVCWINFYKNNWVETYVNLNFWCILPNCFPKKFYQFF